MSVEVWDTKYHIFYFPSLCISSPYCYTFTYTRSRFYAGRSYRTSSSISSRSAIGR